MTASNMLPDERGENSNALHKEKTVDKIRRVCVMSMKEDLRKGNLASSTIILSHVTLPQIKPAALVTHNKI